MASPVHVIATLLTTRAGVRLTNTSTGELRWLDGPAVSTVSAKARAAGFATADRYGGVVIAIEEGQPGVLVERHLRLGTAALTLLRDVRSDSAALLSDTSTAVAAGNPAGEYIYQILEHRAFPVAGLTPDTAVEEVEVALLLDELRRPDSGLGGSSPSPTSTGELTVTWEGMVLLLAMLHPAHPVRQLIDSAGLLAAR
jgi:hypothetical protein